ncbi:hypothetical protein BB560_000810 [Smittium megazygosporum]|uniref:ATP-dependent RNA helicase n=1 Tax=Smittium megazygosporum TaxID=133381 RepID=A0A2T9ZJB4_9FUNG|nr:hypothetical protein BB560_000810 [Smittium megazygosporum]
MKEQQHSKKRSSKSKSNKSPKKSKLLNYKKYIGKDANHESEHIDQTNNNFDNVINPHTSEINEDPSNLEQEESLSEYNNDFLIDSNHDLQDLTENDYDPIPENDSELERPDLDLIGVPEWLKSPKIVDSNLSCSISDSRLALSEQTLLNCKKENISAFFAVQVAAFSLLKSIFISLKYSERARDICVSAPTGSGKTLAYAIPIIEKLLSRVVRRLRAIIVLPTKDLASQVKSVFDKFCRGTHLRVGLASGEVSFVKEQQTLVNSTVENSIEESSKVDILVCTPGRLINHITQTPNFYLDSLEILVMDEADRLMSQGYNDWLNILYKALSAGQNTLKRVLSGMFFLQEATCTIPPPTELSVPFRSVLFKIDIVSRGIDIENVDTVINYDVPISMNQYIHRVGRTARAGKAGSAYSLVGSHEARHFRKMQHTANHLKKLKNLKFNPEVVQEYEELYQTCLDELKELYVSKSKD